MEQTILWGALTIPGNIYAGVMIILNLLMITISVAAIGWLLWKVLSCMTKNLFGIQTFNECFPGCCGDGENAA